MCLDPTATGRPESVNIKSAAKVSAIPPVPINPQPNGSVITLPSQVALLTRSGFVNRRPAA